MKTVAVVLGILMVAFVPMKAIAAVLLGILMVLFVLALFAQELRDIFR